MITMKKRLPSEYIEFIEKCKMKQYKDKNIHKHHILPRFMGGVDEPNNLIELSVTDHFEAHRILAENIDGGYKRGAYASLNLLNLYTSSYVLADTRTPSFLHSFMVCQTFGSSILQ